MSQPPTRPRMRGLALAALLIPALVMAALLGSGLLGSEPLLGSGDEPRLGPIRGLVLGLGPLQAREQLATDGVPGHFRGSTTGEDFALDWAPTPTRPPRSPGRLRSARLEFHLGQLVAARLTLAPDAPEADGPAREVTSASVLVREARGDGVSVTWIARSCPAHADEVRALMRDH